MRATIEVPVRSLVAQLRNGIIDAAFASKYRFLLSASKLLPNAGGGVADFFNETLESVSCDSEVSCPIFDFELVMFAAVAPCSF